MRSGGDKQVPPLRGRLWTDRSGGVAVYASLIAVVLFGVIGLAIDASRAMIVQSESQAAADAAALAGASQLDGTLDAITNATDAVEDLISNAQQMASTGAGAVTIAQIRFLSSLPDDDEAPITEDLVTTDPLEARFIEVTAAPLNHQNSFLLAVGAAASVNITTRAIAGGRQSVCGAAPMMICNPSEVGNPGAPFDVSQWRGRQVRLLYQADSWAPGNFGFLEPGNPGANALRDALASTAGANICYGPDATTEPGMKSGVRAALNTRFDMYENPGFQGERNNPLFAPDVNVRRGMTYQGGNCNKTPTINDAGRMPLDSNLAADPNARFGNGNWDCLSYWNANFTGSGVLRPAGCTGAANGFSRYDMYNYEMSNNLVPVAGAGGETGAPICHGAQNPARPQRRIIIVAVVNCVENNLHGRQTTQVVQFVRLFLTEPVTEPSQVQIVGEIIDVVQPGDDAAVLRDIVQLYR